MGGGGLRFLRAGPLTGVVVILTLAVSCGVEVRAAVAPPIEVDAADDPQRKNRPLHAGGDAAEVGCQMLG